MFSAVNIHVHHLVFIPVHNVPLCFSIGQAGPHEAMSDPMGELFKQEVHFQNIEHMASGCKETAFAQHHLSIVQPSFIASFNTLCKCVIGFIWDLPSIFLASFEHHS